MRNLKRIFIIFLTIVILLPVVPITVSANTYSGTCGDNLTWTMNMESKTLVISGTGPMKQWGTGGHPWDEYTIYIEKLVIEEGVTTITAGSFFGNSWLKSVKLPNTLTRIGDEAFSRSGITSISIPGSVTYISYFVFRGCESLSSVSLGSGIETIKEGAFTDCHIKDVFYYGDIEDWCKINFEGRYANPVCWSQNFYIKGKLVQNLEITNGVTSISKYAFAQCKTLRSIVIPDSVQTIGNYAFYFCTGVNDVRIGDGVTSIGACAFQNCYSSNTYGKDNLYLGKNVELIGYEAFASTETLSYVYYPGTVDDWGKIDIRDRNEGLLGAKKYYEHVHNYSEYPKKTATCLEEGLNVYKCICGLISHYESVPTSDHTQSDWLIDVPVTCESDGLRYKKCKTCGIRLVSEKILSVGHITGNWVEIKRTTCESNGVQVEKCTVCNIELNRKSIDALGHDFGDWIVTQNSTCVTPGVETKFCSRCDEKQTREIKITDHDYVAVVIEPTCTEQGYTVYTCSCKESYKDDFVNALGHIFSEWETTLPTCVSDGFESRSCSRCLETQKRNIVEKFGHSYEKNITAPTCTKRGYTTYICSCGNSYVDDYTDALGHNFGEWITTTPSTCISYGFERRCCTGCDVEESRMVDKTEHNYKEEIVAPTCTERGYTKYTCSCGRGYTDDYVPGKGHTSGRWVVTTPATVTTDGVKTNHCQNCDYVYETVLIPKLGKVHTVSIDPIKIDYKSSSMIFPAVIVDSDVEYTVAYLTSDPSVATVDENGNIYGAGKGNATITCTVTDEFGNIVSDTCDVEVSYQWWQWIIVIVLFGWIWY